MPELAPLTARGTGSRTRVPRYLGKERELVAVRLATQTAAHCAALALFTTLGSGGCGDDPTPQDVYIPKLIFPGEVTVTEGGSTTFMLSTADFSHGDASGVFVSRNPLVTATPTRFDLTPSAPSLMVTVTAGADSNSTNERAVMTPWIPGSVGSPGMQIQVADTNAENVVADPWTLTLPVSTVGTFAVRMTQQPSSTVTVMLSGIAIATITPTTMTFTASNYDMPQICMVSASSTGQEAIALTSDPQLFAFYVVVTVE
jgi:hypothetical protein